MNKDIETTIAKHEQRIGYAIEKLRHLLPLDINKYQNLTEENISAIDQLIFRFGKLQDAMGVFFRETLIKLGENIENKPFIDILELLEKYKLLPDADEWLSLRELRNIATHEYPAGENKQISAINKIVSAVERVSEIHHAIKKYLDDKFPTTTTHHGKRR